jgi:tetrapyrrole methylase family protein / MazG family protein
MDSPGITILGLGPGEPGLLTRQAWQILESSSEVYLRTRQHPVIASLPETVRLFSFDDLYENSQTFEQVYESIVARVLELGKRPQGVIYAVPGHPYMAEATSPEIARRAQDEQLTVRVVEGLSFLEPACTALGIDPFSRLALVDALELVASHVPSFPTNYPALIAQIHSPAVAADLKLTLTSLYPDDHPVKLVHAAGTMQQQVESLALYQIDRSPHIGLLTALYLPPLAENSTFEAFLEVVAHLRAPEGCPWDREQNHLTLRADLLEETYEALTALDAGDAEGLREELGDLLLLILLHTQIASDDGEFTIVDVLRGVHTKIVHRHPHVFGDVQAASAGAVLKNWERLKAEERASQGKGESSLLAGVSLALPALLQAEQYQKRAHHVGFDWSDVQGVRAKLDEELGEVDAAVGQAEQAAEIGDLLFAVVNLARWFHLDAESTLREANARFYKRFSSIEAAARAQSRTVTDLTMDEMEALWQQAKKA